MKPSGLAQRRKVGLDSARVKSKACHTQANSPMPANILNLPRLKVTQVKETDHDYHVNAQAAFDPAA